MKEKILYGFGDSLVDGHYIGIGMLDALAEKYGMDYHKYAVNGAKILPASPLLDEEGRPVPDVAAQIRSASPVVPDFICFDGLTNDAYPDLIDGKLGSLSHTYGGPYDRTTFYGAFEHICFLLREKYAHSLIFYICVHKMPTRDMETQTALQRAARKSCEKWSIPYVDIFRRGQLNTCIDEMRRQYSYNTPDCLADGNGTHLNGKGYEKWYLPMIEAAMKPYL